MVVVDAATGRDVRVVYEHRHWWDGSRIDGSARRPDGSTVYFSVDGAIWRVGVDGAGRRFAAFDPGRGVVDERVELPFRAQSVTYDTSGHHQLFIPVGQDETWMRSGGIFIRIDSPGNELVAW